MKRYGGVYVATNTVTGEQYVGQTTMPVSYRVSNHKSNAKNPKTKFQRALNEFGVDVFSFVEIYTAFDIGALNEAECWFVKELSPVYNSTSGGSGAHRKKSAEECAAISKRLKAQWADPEFKLRATAAIKAACQDEARVERFRALGKTGVGAKKRWARHTSRKVQAQLRRQERVAAKAAELARPKLTGVERSSKAKYKPVLLVEQHITFLSQKFAAEHLNVRHTTITEAIKRGRKVAKNYTLVRVQP